LVVGVGFGVVGDVIGAGVGMVVVAGLEEN